MPSKVRQAGALLTRLSEGLLVLVDPRNGNGDLIHGMKMTRNWDYLDLRVIIGVQGVVKDKLQ